MSPVNYILNQYMSNHHQNIAMEVTTRTFKEAISTQKEYAGHILDLLNTTTASEVNVGQNIDVYV